MPAHAALTDADFNKMFDQLSSVKDDEQLTSPAVTEIIGSETKEPEVAENPTPDTPEPEKPAEDVKTDASEAPVDEKPVETEAEETPESTPEPVVAAKTDTAEDFLRQFQEILKQQPKTEPVQAAPTAPQAPPAPEPELFTPEEKDFLTRYEKDWPDVRKAEALFRRMEYRDLVGYIFKEMAPWLQQLQTGYQTLAERTHLSDLYNSVEDYDAIRDKVVEWAENQPPYLKKAYQNVIKEGTVEEVQDLVARWRQANMPNSSAPAAAKPAVEPSPAVKQAAASLAPVKTKRSAIIQTDDPADFDSAFAEAAKSIS